jgi:hypothetical protein
LIGLSAFGGPLMWRKLIPHRDISIKPRSQAPDQMSKNHVVGVELDGGLGMIFFPVFIDFEVVASDFARL